MMQAISSFRPHTQNGEYRINQKRAFESWIQVFDAVHYFGAPEPELSNPKVTFVPSEEWPTIQILAHHASRMPSRYISVLNADIVISPGIWRVEDQLLRKAAQAATSMRFTFSPETQNFHEAKVTDSGFDVFVATPNIWALVAQAVSKSLRIGHCQWDSWLLGFLNVKCKRNFYDFTKERCVFHPIHGGRHMPHNQKVRLTDRYGQSAGKPQQSL